ncbi:MAG: TRAM domain-containing protein [Bacillota bacterium]|nr:MAG: PIN domain nuclease [Bacillota bacterium]
MRLRKNLRIVLTIAGILSGFGSTFLWRESVALLLSIPEHWGFTLLFFAVGSLLGGLVGFGLYPFVTWLEGRLARTAFIDIILGSVGLISGLLIAALLSFFTAKIPLFGGVISVLSAVIFGYLGMTVTTRKREEVAEALASVVSRSSRKEQGGGAQPGKGREYKGISRPKILDTSVIIDGRIADIVRAGFLEGPLIVPSSVLEELRHIADSPDVLKRNRGRRGLDILNEIQKMPGADVRIYEGEIDAPEVDIKLLKLAKMLGGVVVTNDFNLNKVAGLQGVRVLNINELANALKPIVLPGEEMTVSVVKDGKEPGQGVGYLDDGTMIVVDGGKRYIGDTIDVLVTSVIQTAAGRMIFAKPKVSVEKVAP